MNTHFIQKHYSLSNLDFRDLWDITTHFRASHPALGHIVYSVETHSGPLVSDEPDVSCILRTIARCTEPVESIRVRLTPEAGSQEMPSAELAFYNKEKINFKTGLTLTSSASSKLSVYKFESKLFELFEDLRNTEPNVKFGDPCEILAAVVDIRGFSHFSERPNIESPYLCGVMGAFYQIIQRSFAKYSPEMIKFMGDGVLAVWQTTFEDRQFAVDAAVEGCLRLNSRYQHLRKSPHFTEGTPDSLGVGISIGLGSKLPFDGDYIGRPINVATRLCGVCPGGKVFIDQAVPNLDPSIEKHETTVDVKTYGKYYLWSIQTEGGVLV
ncbi:MAG: adenylate/guanylate cyclase domain-containing protein [Verrucomicrobia bacterium]|nr:adenylate/guanylate cyclase domain-containing protein [Verrucomicrobiota bacterium]MDA1066926.1 adenylate/guanylate cyclase domain-containing protein [Verrucomicrobiota bacterium]